MSIVQLVRGVLPLRPENRPEQLRGGTEGSTRLFRCDSCATTYIDDEMETCPRCDTAVENIPSDRDLGLV